MMYAWCRRCKRLLRSRVSARSGIGRDCAVKEMEELIERYVLSNAPEEEIISPDAPET